MMREQLKAIREEAIKQIQDSGNLDKLNDVRVAFLGKKGQLTAVLKGMKDVAQEERPVVGQLVNDTRASIEKALEETKKARGKKPGKEQMKRRGHRCNSRPRRSIWSSSSQQYRARSWSGFFVGMGYEIMDGEVGTAFTTRKLEHSGKPSGKDEQDTFYINKDIVLRANFSGTGPCHGAGQLPIRMLSPGRVYRSDGRPLPILLLPSDREAWL